MSLDQQRHDWEELAEYDALWAVLTQPEKRGGGWERDEFLATGEAEIAEVLEAARALGLPRRRRRALGTILRRTPLTPMRMSALSRRRVRRIVEVCGGRLLLAEPSNGDGVHTLRSFVTPARG